MESSLKHPKMENLQVKVKTQSQSQEAIKKKKQQQQQQQLVWDCGSTLYDSFELNSFNRQLDSAIVSRTLSMPHLPDRRAPPPPEGAAPAPPVAKKSYSKISRSLQKLLKSVFKSSKHSSSTWLKSRDRSNEEYCLYYDKAGALTTIPEGPEVDFGGLSPERNSLAIRTASERFTAPTIAISCA